MRHALIAVADVPASSRFYQRLLACRTDTDADHPHRLEYDRIVDGDGALVLELHSAVDHGTPIDDWLSQPVRGPRGEGIVLHFQVDDLTAAEARIRELGAETVGDVYAYPDGTSRLIVRDPDGYVVALYSATAARTSI
jgi:predicted enzyme related to lactoylglutathione lyase